MENPLTEINKKDNVKYSFKVVYLYIFGIGIASITNPYTKNAVCFVLTFFDFKTFLISRDKPGKSAKTKFIFNALILSGLKIMLHFEAQHSISSPTHFK